MRVAIIDPFYDDSHQQWTRGLVKYSSHEFVLITQSPHHWKWRMASGALYSANQINLSTEPFDLLLATDMVNVPLLKAQLSPKHISTPIVLYFHENQITYPWSVGDPDLAHQRDYHYGWINYTSALTADQLFFNSRYHHNSFIGALKSFLSRFPQEVPVDSIESIAQKSSILPLGMDFKGRTNVKDSTVATILWNHRWEADKNPDEFFRSLLKLKANQIEFRLIVCGKALNRLPKIFKEIERLFKKELIHLGYVKTREAYINLLEQSDILFVTSYQDFFGISVVEAIHHGCYPILPNRLAYPEHIPVLSHEDHLYNNENEMMQLLRSAVKSRQDISHVQNHVSQYSWANLIGDYDKAIIKASSKSGTL